MSGYTCAQVRDAAPELALGVLGGAERAEVLIHLTNCTRCQVHVAELTEAADVIPLLAPEREPPPGFEQRVLANLHADRRRSRRRLAALVAVAAAAAAIVSITLVQVIDAGRESSAPSSAAPISMARAQMVSEADGTSAGWVEVTGGRVVAVEVWYGVAAGTYDIEVASGQADPVVIGDMDVEDARWSWYGRSDVDIATGDRIALVGATGTRVCHGTVEAAG